MIFNYLKSLTFLSSLLSVALCQKLSATLLDIKFPFGHQGSSPVYDGDDTIYLIGGLRGVSSSYNKDIWRFNISDPSSLQLIGSLPTECGRGSAQANSDGIIFCFCGQDSGRSNIISFDPRSNETSIILNMTYLGDPRESIKTSRDSNTAYCLGGDQEQIFSFDMDTGDFTDLGYKLPCKFSSTLRAIQFGDSAYLFGSNVNCDTPTTDATTTPTNTPELADPSQSVFKLDLETFEVEMGPPNFPKLSERASLVSDGEFIYVIGGFSENTSRTDGIIQFKPATFEWTFFPVDDFPVPGINDTYFKKAPTSVYVEKENRIYMFGGYTWGIFTSFYTPRAFQDIWYIDLSPVNQTPELPSTTTLNPDVFTCEGRDDGLYPHPSDCSQFIICYEQVAEIFKCPPPLLFNPVTKACSSPNTVICELTCVSKPDGNYPHPHDCSLFLVCYDEIMDIYKCPPPLLFDPINRNCNLPQLVDCGLV